MSAHQRIATWRATDDIGLVGAEPGVGRRAQPIVRAVRPAARRGGVVHGGRLTSGQHSIFMSFVKLMLWMARHNG